MQLVIIEPHQHFELILALKPVLFSRSEPAHVVCSDWVRDQVILAEPAFENQVIWNTDSGPNCPIEPSILLFTSLQYKRKKWLPWIQRWPTAIMIHNANLYVQVLPPLSRAEANYSFIKYFMERYLRNPFRKRMSIAVLQHLDAIIPYSPAQSAFLNQHLYAATFTLSVAWNQSVSVPSDYDFLPVYGRSHQLDQAFIDRIEMEFAEKILCLCHPNEHNLCKKTFPDRTKFIFTPLPHTEYLQFFQQARRIIIPMQSTLSFGLTREILGKTKYLARIHWALQFQKPLLMPADIPEALLPDSPDGQIVEFEAIEEYLEGIKS